MLSYTNYSRLVHDASHMIRYGYRITRHEISSVLHASNNHFRERIIPLFCMPNKWEISIMPNCMINKNTPQIFVQNFSKLFIQNFNLGPTQVQAFKVIPDLLEIRQKDKRLPISVQSRPTYI